MTQPKPMTPEQFCYWLQGYFELALPGRGLTTRQVGEIQRHLQSVFTPIPSAARTKAPSTTLEELLKAKKSKRKKTGSITFCGPVDLQRKYCANKPKRK